MVVEFSVLEFLVEFAISSLEWTTISNISQNANGAFQPEINCVECVSEFKNSALSVPVILKLPNCLTVSL